MKKRADQRATFESAAELEALIAAMVQPHLEWAFRWGWESAVTMGATQ